MSFVAMLCPSCGGPLPPEARKRTVVCAFCGASVMHDRWMAKRAQFTRAFEDERNAARTAGGERVEVGGRSYSVTVEIAHGEATDVLLAERADGVRERVVLQLLRDPTKAAYFEQSRATLTALGAHERLVRRIPRLRLEGTATRNGAVQSAAVFRYESGFFQTLWDVRALHGARLSAAHAVWIWRRLLEVLASVHDAGWLHRALVPQHLVVHARDHGVLLVGWGAAAQTEAPLTALVEPFADLYPEEALAGEPFTRRHDIMMSARCVGWLLRDGDGWQPGRATPSPLRDLLLSVGSGKGNESANAAVTLDAELKRRAAQAFGAPTYQRLEMPGWK